MTVGGRIISLFSLSSLAVLVCTLTASPVTAVSLEVAGNSARSLHARGHDALAKRKRSPEPRARRCRPKSQLSGQSSAPNQSPPPAPKPAAPAPAPAPQGPPSGKLGLGWANGDQFLSQYAAAKVMYTWGPECPASASKLGIQCCRMLWGWDQVGRFQNAISQGKPSCVMGPNEPEIHGQSNMSPESGAQLWNTYIKPLQNQGVLTISPATTSDNRNGEWLQAFGKACDGNPKGLCGANILAVHWYDLQAQNFIDYVENLHNIFNKDVWVTEFAVQNFNGGGQASQGEVWAFQSQVINWARGVPWVKLFPFTFMRDMQGVNTFNQGMNQDGSPNAFGRAWLGL